MAPDPIRPWRDLLARQGLLERRKLSLPRMLERMGTLQAQYAPSMYVGLFSRVEGFEFGALDRALARRTVVQATLMRSTIHLVSRADYWPLALATRESRRRLFTRAYPGVDFASAAERLREVTGPFTRTEVEALVGKEPARGIHAFCDLVRVPPSGTWERRRAALWEHAEAWVGPPPEPDGGALLIRRYLGGYGPATRHDIASFTGLTLAEIDAVPAEVPRAPRHDPDLRPPVRLIGHWDAILLVHARRTGVLPEEYRERIFNTKRPHSTAVFLVDGRVAGEWSLDGSFEPYGKLNAADRRELQAELERFKARP